jgi:hypothetical protein
MKMMYFSSDVLEVEHLRREFVEAGIPCEVRHGPLPHAAIPNSSHSELWILEDADTHRALMLCVELGVGFAKRSRKRPAFDD